MLAGNSKTKDKTTPPVPPAKINLNDQRRTIALVVDDLGISFESMSILRAQIRKFLDTLSPDDLVAIIRTGGDVGSLQQFTNDRRVLQSAVDRLRWNPVQPRGDLRFSAGGRAGRKYKSLFGINNRQQLQIAGLYSQGDESPPGSEVDDGLFLTICRNKIKSLLPTSKPADLADRIHLVRQ
jgi:hypothetical protein